MQDLDEVVSFVDGVIDQDRRVNQFADTRAFSPSQNPLARLLRIELGNPLRDQLPDFFEGDGTAFANVSDPTVNSGKSFGGHRYLFSRVVHAAPM